MRILIVNKFARVTGGADSYCLALAAALRTRGHEVALFATSHPDNSESEGAFVPTTVTRENRTALGARREMRIAASALWNHEAYRAMRALLVDFKPDVVSAHKLYPQLSVSPIVAAKRVGIPVVQTVHDYEFVSASPIDDKARWIDRDEASLRFRALNSSLFVVKHTAHRRCVARWVAVSKFVARTLSSRGIDACVVTNLAPAPAARPPGFRERAGIVFAGRLAPEKGIGDVIRLAELLPKIGVTVAGDGPARASVEDAARRLPNLLYLGPLDREGIDRLLAGALAVVVPSVWQEPGALVTLEAMAHGTPLVVYRVGGIGEYVAESGAGFVVEQTPEALAAACASLIDDAETWRRLSAAGTSAAAGPHSLDTHCGALEQVFAEAASDSEGGRSLPRRRSSSRVGLRLR